MRQARGRHEGDAVQVHGRSTQRSGSASEAIVPHKLVAPIAFLVFSLAIST
jgi:hypothetical protein